MTKLDKLMEQLGHRFKDLALLKHALSHRSAGPNNNERLEFLGDSVLGFIIAHELYESHPDAKEGDLSRMRASLVNGETLAVMATYLGVSDCLRLGEGEQKSGGKTRHSILADALEAIVGAIYMDSNLSTCRRCVLAWYEKCDDDLSQLTPTKDAKSRLQEWLQTHKLPLPSYRVGIAGEAHAQVFTVTCRIKGLPHATKGVGSSRRKAEQMAAARYLELLHE